jgi:POT family proton-dependent oligopeptide transporter
MLPIVVYFIMLAVRATPEEKPGLASLIPVYIAGGAFFMVLHLSGGLMTVFAEHNTNRQAEWIPNSLSFYGQKAMPSYFDNAGPEVARPDPQTLVVAGEDAESMFGARILKQSLVDSFENDPSRNVLALSPKELPAEERFLTCEVYADDNVGITTGTDVHGVTTTSVKVSPEGASALRSIILTRPLAGSQVPVILVSQATFDAVYENTNDGTPGLAPGKYVRLLNAEMITALPNPVFVVVLTPLVVGFFAWMAARGRQVSTARKIFYGMVITAISILVMAWASYVGQNGAIKTAMMWLLLYYLIITFGELCLSPMGLSLVTKLAPKRLVGLMMGGWFLATSIGNKLAGFISGLEPTTQMFVILTVAISGVAAFLYALLPRLDAAINKYGA